MSNATSGDPEQSRRFLELIQPPGSTLELRVLGVRRKGDRRASRAEVGYFRDAGKLLQTAWTLEKEADRYDGAYLVLNEVEPACYARSPDRLRPGGAAAKAEEIRRRRVLLIDVDPVTAASGVMADEAERAAVRVVVAGMREHLKERGWPGPAVLDTGNGIHILFGIDVPTEDGGLVKRVLEALDCLFSTERAHVDTSTHDAARLSRVPGTWNRKGESVGDRVHRKVQVLELPAALEPVPSDKLAELAASAPEAPSEQGGTREGFDLEIWLRRHNLSLSKQGPWKGGMRYELETCPFDATHLRKAVIVRRSDGRLGATCLKTSCQLKSWRTLREHLEPGCYAAPHTRSTRMETTSTQASALPEAWLLPLPLQAPPADPPVFPLDKVVPARLGWLSRYVDSLAHALQVPVELVAELILPIAAATVAKKVIARPDQLWREQPSIYGMLLMPSGTRKTSVLRQLLEPVVGAMPAQIQAGGASTDSGDPPAGQAPGRWVTTEATPEALAELMARNGERALVATAEADALDILLGRYSKSGSPSFGIYQKGYDGEYYAPDRVTRAASVLRAPVLNVAMAVQPTAALALLADPQARGRGLLARFHIVRPRDTRGHRSPESQGLDERLAAHYRAVIQALNAAPLLASGEPAVVTLAPDARELLRGFQREMEEAQAEGGRYVDMPDYLSKAAGAAVRIALVLHELAAASGFEGFESSVYGGCASPEVATSNPIVGGVMQGEEMAAGIEWTRFHVEARRHALEVAEEDTRLQHARRILDWIQKGFKVTFTQRECHQNCRRVEASRSQDCREAVDLLIQLHYLREIARNNPPSGGGRPAGPLFEVNPAVHRTYAHADGSEGKSEQHSS